MSSTPSIPDPSRLPHDDIGPMWMWVGWSLTIVATLCVIARSISRTAFGKNNLRLDDYITFVCLCWDYAAAIATTLAVQAGAGKHIWDVSPSSVPNIMYHSLIMSSINIWNFSMPKFAIIALLGRLLPLKKQIYYSLWTFAIINQGGIMAASIMWFTRCSPTSANWDPLTSGAVCGSIQPLEILGWVTSAISAILDLFFALFPVPYVMKLNMPLTRRVAISASLALGGVASAISIYKITTIPKITVELPADPTYALYPLNLWAHVEANVLIITASLPTVGPIIRFVLNQRPFVRTQERSRPTDRQHGRFNTSYASAKKGWSPLPRHVTGTEALASQDGIPLVETDQGRFGPGRSNDGGVRRETPQGGIYKSVHISISRELA